MLQILLLQETVALLNISIWPIVLKQARDFLHPLFITISEREAIRSALMSFQL